MNTYRTFGPLGLIVLSFGLIAGLLTADWASLYVLSHLILGGMMLGLYLFTHVDRLRETMVGRQARHGTNAIVYTVVTLTVVVLVNFLAVRNPVRWDVTEEGVFSLASQTTQLLDGLDVDVVARGFFKEGEEGQARDLLDSFAAASPRFTYEFVDPDKRPELAEQYEITQYNTIHLTAGAETTRVTETSEEAVTNALIRISSAQRRVAYYITGHGEPDLEDSNAERGFGQARAALSNEGWDVEPLALGNLPDIPADAELLILAGPERPLLEQEIAVLRAFMRRGGHLLAMLDPQRSPELVPMLAEFGVRVGDDIVIEQFVQLFAGASLGVEPVVSDYDATHPVTSGFGERTVFRLARSVTPMAELPSGIEAVGLVRTSSSSWAESDLTRLFDSGEVQLDDADVPGPIDIAVAVTATGDALQWVAPRVASAVSGEVTAATDAEAAAPADMEGRFVIFGDSDWTTNRSINLYYNQDLLLNAVGWMGGQEELISIRPRSTRASQVMLTSNESQAVFYLTVLLLPELILFFGMLVWLGRRYR